MMDQIFDWCVRVLVYWAGLFWNHVQRNQCLGFCDPLADIDCYPDWHYRRATKKNPPIIKGMTRES